MLLLMQQAAYQLYVYLRAGSCTIELWLKVNCIKHAILQFILLKLKTESEL